MAAKPAIATELADATGRVVSFSDPRRIVSIGGAATETIFALGEGKRIAAIDTTSTYPPEAGALPNVGYMRALSAEGVLAIGPDLVMALEGAGPPAAISALERSRVPVLMVPNRSSTEGAIEKIDFIGKALAVESRAAELSARIGADLKDLAASLAGSAEKPRVLFILSTANGKMTVAGEKSSADAMIALAGGVNAISGFDGYKAASAEALVVASPDAIVMMSNLMAPDAADQVLASASLAASPAVANKRIALMEGTYLLGFGPRLAEAARDLAHFLHPELKLRSG
ncbi:MAG: ABC transporter substrate-binding protein [Rhizobiales bacterium]|nr:ABC transporter substrate-binding protein [Hyphomicrobiales bacterium]